LSFSIEFQSISKRYAAGAAGAAGITSFIRWAEQPGPQAELRNSAWLEYDCGTVPRHSSSMLAPCSIRHTAYDSAHGSVRLYGCAAVCSSVRQCAQLLVCDSVQACVWQCLAVSTVVCAHNARSARSSVWQCDWLCAAVCGSVWQCQRTAQYVCGSAVYVYVHKVAHNRYYLTGAVLMCLIFLAY
jgi:hypothetical protein